MTTPGFTAEVSCYRTSAPYSPRTRHASSTDYFTTADMSGCGACTCDPGMCCELGLWSCRCKLCGSSVEEARPLTLLRA